MNAKRWVLRLGLFFAIALLVFGTFLLATRDESEEIVVAATKPAPISCNAVVQSDALPYNVDEWATRVPLANLDSLKTTVSLESNFIEDNASFVWVPDSVALAQASSIASATLRIYTQNIGAFGEVLEIEAEPLQPSNAHWLKEFQPLDEYSCPEGGFLNLLYVWHRPAENWEYVEYPPKHFWYTMGTLVYQKDTLNVSLRIPSLLNALTADGPLFADVGLTELSVPLDRIEDGTIVFPSDMEDALDVLSGLPLKVYLQEEVYHTSDGSESSYIYGKIWLNYAEDG